MRVDFLCLLSLEVSRPLHLLEISKQIEQTLRICYTLQAEEVELDCQDRTTALYHLIKRCPSPVGSTSTGAFFQTTGLTYSDSQGLARLDLKDQKIPVAPQRRGVVSSSEDAA